MAKTSRASPLGLCHRHIVLMAITHWIHGSGVDQGGGTLPEVPWCHTSCDASSKLTKQVFQHREECSVMFAFLVKCEPFWAGLNIQGK